GTPEVCTLYHWRRSFFPDTVDHIAAGCRAGSLGCVEDKSEFARQLAEHLAPFRERRAELASKRGMAEDVLAAGRAKLKPIAEETLGAVRDAMRLPVTE